MLGWINKNIIEKIDIHIVLITFLILCYFLSDSREGFKEGNWMDDAGSFFRDAGHAIEDAARKLMDEIQNAMNEFVEKLKQISPERIAQELRKPFDQAGELFNKGINEAKDGIDKMGKSISGPFADFISRIRRVGDGINDIFLGIGEEFVGVGNGLRLGFEDSAVLLEYTGEYFATNILCGLKGLVYFPFCAFFYIIDWTGYVIYLPIRIFLHLFNSMGVKDVYETEAYFWKQIRAYDNVYIFKKYGYYLTHWPKNIRDACYNCKRLKSEVLKRKADVVNTDFTYKMPALLGGGAQRMRYGGDEILSAFQ